MSQVYYSSFRSPVGELLLVGDETGLQQLRFAGESRTIGKDWLRRHELFRDLREQLRAYFAGDLQRFSVQLAPQGSAFQQQVWEALLGIPYGETSSYANLAEKIGRPAAVRALGGACGRNPIPIIIPCHRVIGSSGGLTGFSGGIGIKQQLLTLEQLHRPFELIAQPG